MRSLLKISAIAVAMWAVLPADAQIFDFESETPTYVGPGPRPGALTSLSMTIDGVTVVITRSSGLPFDLVDNTSAGQTGKPPTWGGVSLDPFFAPTAGDYFIATFSHYVSGVSIDFGDYGGDTDHAFLSAFSGMGATGAFLGGDAALWTGTFPSFGFLTYTQLTPGIRSIAFGNLPGDDFVPSLFFDNLSLRGVAIPGPAAALVFGVGLLGRRRRRS